MYTRLVHLMVLGAVMACAGTGRVSAQAVLLWEDYFAGLSTPSYNEPVAVQVDAEGNAYTLANLNQESSFSIGLMKYSPAGERLWTRQLSATNASSTLASSLVIDASTNVYVTGYGYTGDNGFLNLWLAKYRNDGALDWQFHGFPTLSNVHWTPKKIAIDPAGNALLFGHTFNFIANTQALFLIKFSPAGQLLWQDTYAGEKSEDSARHAGGMGLDAEGNAYIAGTVVEPNQTATRIFTASYSPDGQRRWTRQMAPMYGWGTLDQTWVTTNGVQYFGVNISWYFSIVKVNPEGIQEWETSTRGYEGVSQTIRHLRTDGAGNLYVGAIDNTQNQTDWVVNKLSPEGDWIWSARYHGGGQDVITDMELDADGNLYAVGSSSDATDTVLDGTIIKFSPQGYRLWVHRGRASGGFWTQHQDLALDPQGDFLVTCRSVYTSGYHIGTLKFTQEPDLEFPPITFPPSTIDVVQGSNAVLTVRVDSAEPPAYVWYFNGSELPGETNSTLLITNAQGVHAGGYAVGISNSTGFIVSPESLLVIKYPPSIAYLSSTNLQVVAGGSPFILAYAEGTPPVHYQWRLNGTNLPGETAVDLRLYDVQPGANEISLVVTNAYGTFVLGPIPLNVRAAETWDRWEWIHPQLPGTTLKDVVYGNGNFVAVGARGTILSSSNGVDWTVRHTQGPTLQSVEYANGLFIASASESDMLGSTNLVEWFPIQTPESSNIEKQLAYGNGRWLAMTYDTLYTSTNGIEWIKEPTGSIEAQQAFFTGDRFGAIIYSQLYVSQNGSDWQRLSQLEGEYTTGGGYGDGQFCMLGASKFWFSSDGTNWTPTAPIPLGHALTSCAYGNGRWVAVGDNGNICVSTNRQDWQWISKATTDNMRGIAVGGGTAVAVGNNGCVWTSRDMLNWSQRQPVGPVNLRAVAYGATYNCGGTFYFTDKDPSFSCWPVFQRFVAVGEDGAIFHSNDGGDWAPASGRGTNSLFGVGYGQGQFVAVGDNGEISTSPDGVSWTRRNSPTSYRLQGITYAAGLYVATGRRQTILVSSNAVNWSLACYSYDGPYIESVAYGPGVGFVAVGHSGSILFSAGGYTWQSVTSGVPWELESVHHANGIFFVVGDRGTVLTSTNGLDWQLRQTPLRDGLRQAVFAQGALYVVGNNQMLIKSSQLFPWIASTKYGPQGMELTVLSDPAQPTLIQARDQWGAGGSWQTVYDCSGTARSVFIDPDSLQRPNRFYRIRTEFNP